MKKLTIYEIKRRVKDSSPKFFDRSNMKRCEQTLKSFMLTTELDGRIKLMAPIKKDGVITGYTVRYFNPITNKLEQRNRY